MPNPWYTKNIRTESIGMDSGKEVQDTQVLSGMATKTKAENEHNETTQFVNKGGVAGKQWGGENSGS